MARVMLSEYWDHEQQKAIRSYSLHDSIFPPGLMELNGDMYIMPGWYKLDKDEHNIKLEDIKFYPWKAPKPEGPEIPKDKVFKVKSSKGDKEYILQANSTGSLECSCPGYGFRRKCRHIEEVKQSLK